MFRAVREQRAVDGSGGHGFRFFQYIDDALVGGRERLRLGQRLEQAHRFKTCGQVIDEIGMRVDDGGDLIRARTQLTQITAQAFVDEIEQQRACRNDHRQPFERRECHVHQAGK